MREKIGTLTAKMFRLNGERFSEETEAIFDRIEKHIWTGLKIWIVITLWMLIFGDSRYIEGDVPLAWRVVYEWKHLINDILFHFNPNNSA